MDRRGPSLALILAAAALPAAAETTGGPAETLAVAPDLDLGAYLAAECLTCHQASGETRGMPAITGWPAADFTLALRAYRQKLRPDPAMQMIAGRLSEAEIAALAAYFATLD